jgi:hypothetical protein
MQEQFNIHKSINIINHKFISIDAEEGFDKVQHPFIIRAPQKN